MGLFSSKSSSETSVNPMGFISGNVYDYLDMLRDATGSIEGGYQGPMTAPTDPNQLMGAGSLLDAAGGLYDYSDLLKNTGGSLLDSWGAGRGLYDTMMDPRAAASQQIDLAGMFADNPYTQGILDEAGRRATESYRENVLGPMAGQYAAGGVADSSKYAQNFARQNRELGADIYGFSQGFLGDQWNQGLQYGQMAQQGGLSVLDSLLANGINLTGQGYETAMRPGQIQMGVGDYLQGLQDKQIGGRIMEFYEPMNAATQAGAALHPFASLYTKTKTKQKSSPSTFGTIANLAMQAGAAYMTGGASLAAQGAMGGLQGMGGGGGGGFVPSAQPTQYGAGGSMYSPNPLGQAMNQSGGLWGG
jgi:hypothetical protein